MPHLLCLKARSLGSLLKRNGQSAAVLVICHSSCMGLSKIKFRWHPEVELVHLSGTFGAFRLLAFLKATAAVGPPEEIKLFLVNPFDY